MDDNHFLIEWLAYHYHTANLRHLIITSDPQSKTSPSKVLDRWRDRITIEEWGESRFMPEDFDETETEAPVRDKKKEMLQDHRYRQASFNVECLIALKKQNRSWTLLADSDEYLLPKNIENAKTDATTSNTIAHLLGKLSVPAESNEIYGPCIPINRRQFSAKESLDENVQTMVSPEFDGKNFQTLRWRHYGQEKTYYTTTWGSQCLATGDIPNKVMIDLSRISMDYLLEDYLHTGNPHQPLDICPEAIYGLESKTPFLLNHYMGTPEQWFYRTGDKRGIGYRRARYEDLNHRIGSQESDSIRPWLADFVNSVGSKEASRLLKGVGKLEPLPHAQEVALGEKQEGRTNKTSARYQVGDVVEANYKGDGFWDIAEVYTVYSNNFYSVFFEDCSQEIGTFEERLRPTNKTGNLEMPGDTTDTVAPTIL